MHHQRCKDRQKKVRCDVCTLESVKEKTSWTIAIYPLWAPRLTNQNTPHFQIVVDSKQVQGIPLAK